MVYNGNTDRAAEIILEHKIKCRATQSVRNYQCENCNFICEAKSELNEHAKTYHKEVLSPESKKTKTGNNEDEALQQFKSLSVSDTDMDVDMERKRKREEHTKPEEKKLMQEPNSLKNKRDPRLRELPKSVKPLVEVGSEEYVVKGDGPCLLRTTAAHTMGDENEGPQLARDKNTHMSMYRNVYQEKNAADFPLTVTVGVNGETETFETVTEYFDWLQESKKAAFMWSSCVDVMAVSNMAHMDIDIIVHEEGKIPYINSFKEDPDFPWLDDDPMKPNSTHNNKQGKMTVLNWKNVHFNLIVGKNHMLSKARSISFQCSGDSQAAKEDRQEDTSPGERDQAGDSLPSDLAVEDTRGSRVEDSELEQDPEQGLEKGATRKDTGRYFCPPQEQEGRSDLHQSCEKKLAVKQEEIVRLKRHIKTLQNKLQDKNQQYDEGDIQELDSEACLVGSFVNKVGFSRTNPQVSSHPIIKCTKCGVATKSQRELKSHLDSKHPEGQKKIPHNSKGELNCDECQFQANAEPELRKHLNTLKHKAAAGIKMSHLADTFRCKDCGDEFSDFWNLMNHRRDTHQEKRRRCRNDVKGECNFEDVGPNGMQATLPPQKAQ